MQTTALLQKTLADHGYKVTKPRLDVFAALHSNSPLAMADLIKSLSGKVDRVTVYRTTDLFERLGIIKRITVGWKYTFELGDLFSKHHHHITCLRCGKITAIRENEEIERLIENLGSESGFYTTAHQLELQGYCSLCRSTHDPTTL